MFFNTATIYKVTNTQAAAERYIAKWMSNRTDIKIEKINDQFFIVGA